VSVELTPNTAEVIDAPPPHEALALGAERA
jgi:hypothetical protein